jgi:hypothetical protein
MGRNEKVCFTSVHALPQRECSQATWQCCLQSHAVVSLWQTRAQGWPQSSALPHTCADSQQFCIRWFSRGLAYLKSWL